MPPEERSSQEQVDEALNEESADDSEQMGKLEFVARVVAEIVAEIPHVP